jgi:tape measure domain-containing protein
MSDAIEVANAYVALLVKMPGAKSEIEKELGAVDAEGAGRKIGRSASDGAGKGFALGGAIAGITATLASGIADSIGGLVSEAVQASDATDKFKKTLDFAGIDNSTIATLTDQTQAYADATVYDIGTIQNTVAQLAANGVANYEQLAEASGNLNAVAGGNADTFKSVSMMLTQTAGAGKLTTENWNQLADAIPGASGILQKALLDAGAYTGNFRDAMEKGEITADEFNAAIMQVGSTPIAVEAAKSTTTFEGALGSLQATIVGGLAGALTAVKPLLTGLITGFGDVLQHVFDFIGAFSQGIDLGMFAELLGYMSPLGVAFKLLEPMLPLLGAAFQQIAQVLGGVLAAVLPVLAQAFTILGNTLANIVSRVLPVLLPMIVQLAQLFGSVLAQVLPMLIPIISQLATVFVQVLVAVMPIVQALLGALMPIFEALAPLIVTILNAFLPLISALVDALAPILTTVADIIAAVLVPVLNTIVQVVQWLASVITWFVTEIVVPFFQNVLIPAISGAGQAFQDVFGGLGDFFAGIWQGISDGFTGFINFIIDGINGFLGGLNEVGNFISDATGGAIDFNIGSIPHLANGGIVSGSSGGTLALLGEAGPGRDEAVVPLPPDWRQNGIGGGGNTINVFPTPGMDEYTVAKIAAREANTQWR